MQPVTAVSSLPQSNNEQVNNQTSDSQTSGSFGMNNLSGSPTEYVLYDYAPTTTNESMQASTDTSETTGNINQELKNLLTELVQKLMEVFTQAFNK